MTINWQEFTPITSLIGGVILGLGIVSVGDVVKQMMTQLKQNASFLETYIRGHSA